MSQPSVELVRRALLFYARSPDGQYDLDVVVPVLTEWLIARSAPCDHQWSIVTFKDGTMYGLGIAEECLRCLKRRAIGASEEQK